MSKKIYENLLDFVYIYPPSLLIIYSLVIIKNKCNVNINETLQLIIEKIFSDSGQYKGKDYLVKRAARKEQLTNTNNKVIWVFGSISLLCYLLIRFFMDNIKDKIDLQEVQCKLKKQVTDTLQSDIKESSKKSKEDIISYLDNLKKKCIERGSDHTNKNDKCQSCITLEQKDRYYQGFPCELSDSNDSNIQISGELNQNRLNVTEKCKFYINDNINDRSETAKINKGLYIFNNLGIFLLLMFSGGYGLIHCTHNKLAFILPVIIIIGIGSLILVLYERFNWTNDSNIYIFNGILSIIIAVIHVMNIVIYKRYFL
jgi:hypothetical protein